ncbi:hypothetical protein LEN26_002815 [Aphanomyces euteiches]|nr:hypothetical protein AeMF1_021189 [Aphanomyces euteiches]KAH9158677.1 hypothetical protein LEN26_002815 [Aphanomyces euteiches]KAH9185413.1 hypothetical protein AeNC1_012609 [Aphanomyces euteiches]
MDFKRPPSDYTKRYQNHADRDVLRPSPTKDESGLSSPSLVKTNPLIEPPVVFVSKLSESLCDSSTEQPCDVAHPLPKPITSGDSTCEYETDDASTPFDLPPLEPLSDEESDNESGPDELETKPMEIHQKSSLHSEATSESQLVTNPLHEPDQPDLSRTPDLTITLLRSNEIPAPVFTPAQIEAIVTGDFVGISESAADIEARMMPISSADIEGQIRKIRSRRKDPAHTDLVTAITKTLKRPLTRDEKIILETPDALDDPDRWLKWFETTLNTCEEARRASRDFRNSHEGRPAIVAAIRCFTTR